MKENIVIVGAGTESNLIGRTIAHLMPDDVIIVDAENVKKEQLPFPKSEPFILHNPYPPELKSIYEGKQFVCKGKHQYKKIVKNNLIEWICQCGRKTND